MEMPRGALKQPWPIAEPDISRAYLWLNKTGNTRADRQRGGGEPIEEGRSFHSITVKLI
jgi:hypothetical protein